MASQEEFDKAAQDVKNLKARPTDQQLLELYALFKQATEGDCNTDRPGILDFKGRAKWDAWDAKKGMSKDDARTAYVKHAKAIIEEYGLN